MSTPEPKGTPKQVPAQKPTEIAVAAELASVEAPAEMLVDPPLDLEEPAQLDAVWVASGYPSGYVTREAMQDAGWDAVPQQVQEEAIGILDAQEGPV